MNIYLFTSYHSPLKYSSVMSRQNMLIKNALLTPGLHTHSDLNIL